MATLNELESKVRSSAPLTDRLTECVHRVGLMCSEGRPPRMSVPAQWDDDDIFITITLQDAQRLLADCRLTAIDSAVALLHSFGVSGDEAERIAQLPDETYTCPIHGDLGGVNFCPRC